MRAEYHEGLLWDGRTEGLGGSYICGPSMRLTFFFVNVESRRRHCWRNIAITLIDLEIWRTAQAGENV